MARDRLAPLKANGGGRQNWEQEVSSGSQYPSPAGFGGQSDPSYPAVSSYPPAASQSQSYRPLSNPDTSVLRSPAETLDEFMNQQATILELIKTINANSTEMRQVNQRSINEVSQSSAAQLRQRVDELSEHTTKLIERARGGVRTLKQSKRGDKNIRQNQYKATLVNLRAAVQQFYNAQKEVRSSYNDKVIRQYGITRPDASEQEIAAAVEGRTDVFGSAILSSRIQDRQQVLGQVQDRERQLEKLGHSMDELASLTRELQAMIEDQQDMVDLIDQEVDEAADNLKTARDALDKAAVRADAARKRKWIIFWIVLAVIVIIAAIIAIYIAINKKNS
ncbi:Plasma membrane t-SNARE, secretory vesicle fusion [Cladochytrium tenue]|nr:Plasma membrane t-SNARE, secretory vesicle fusion [Cladochytrium tenue]